jgi:hypothetical protein
LEESVAVLRHVRLEIHWEFHETRRHYYGNGRGSNVFGAGWGRPRQRIRHPSNHSDAKRFNQLDQGDQNLGSQLQAAEG